MKKLIGINSPRSIENFQSAKIVYEWEDEISEKSNLPIYHETKLKFRIYSIIERLNLFDIYNTILRGKKLRLRFIMTAKLKKECVINKNTIPVIIDYWLKDEDIPSFVNVYKYCPLILVTNAEVYYRLKRNGVKLPIEHWPLSYPDKYAIRDDNSNNKVYEFCVLGRPNPFFIRFLDKYCKTHPDFSYVKNGGSIENRYYETNNGEFIVKDTGRKSYIDMIKKTKITCYTTPGYDESKSESTEFNQVTPRVFEFLCGGCHVIGHYPMTEDVIYYNLPSVIENVENYEEFESVLDRMRKTPNDIKKTTTFMNKHYTSTRVPMLKTLCLKHNICF